jgi:hypothetical protein
VGPGAICMRSERGASFVGGFATGWASAAIPVPTLNQRTRPTQATKQTVSGDRLHISTSTLMLVADHTTTAAPGSRRSPPAQLRAAIRTFRRKSTEQAAGNPVTQGSRQCRSL